jgi:hypothetical protein
VARRLSPTMLAISGVLGLSCSTQHPDVERQLGMDHPGCEQMGLFLQDLRASVAPFVRRGRGQRAA